MYWLLVLWLVWGGAKAAGEPTIAIIIDDMGNQRPRGEQALALPGAVTYSFLPHCPLTPELARRAHALGKGVMLHLPMESHGQANLLGPGALTSAMGQEELHGVLEEDLQAVPYAAGVNNHMGSLLTARAEPMAWLMQAMSRRADLFFVDSRTTTETLGESMANRYRVPVLRRDVFLDNLREPAAIEQQFWRLLAKARREGHALAIGHPYPETLEVLERLIPRLSQEGVRLVSIQDQLNGLASRVRARLEESD